jgi:hypothetical protein
MALRSCWYKNVPPSRGISFLGPLCKFCQAKPGNCERVFSFSAPWSPNACKRTYNDRRVIPLDVQTAVLVLEIGHVCCHPLLEVPGTFDSTEPSNIPRRHLCVACSVYIASHPDFKRDLRYRRSARPDQRQDLRRSPHRVSASDSDTRQRCMLFQQRPP